MAKTTYLYEVLFRLDPDGLQGAHAVYMDRYTDDETGDIIAEKMLSAEPIKPAGHASELLGKAVAEFSEQVVLQKRAIEALIVENNALSAQLLKPKVKDTET